MFQWWSRGLNRLGLGLNWLGLGLYRLQAMGILAQVESVELVWILVAGDGYFGLG